jgi:hypothetical protein
MIKQISAFLHELASQDTMNSMKDFKQLMDQAAQSGMLTGIGDVQGFKTRFRGIVEKARNIAEVLGTSISEAMPLFNQMNRMGMWTAQDVMGTAVGMRAVGAAAAPGMLNTMQAGASLAHQMGGSMTSGARAGGLAFQQVNAALTGGTLSERQLLEFTGGIGGVAGQQQVAQTMMGLSSQFSQTPAGRLMMAGLGQTKEGAFTGRIDEGRLSAFMRGDISSGQLQSMGKAASGTREGAASFFRQEGMLGQSLMEQGGLAGMGAMFKGVLGERFAGAGENVQHMLLRKMTGMSNREAEMATRLINELPRIQDEIDRKTSGALEDSMRRMEERRVRSFAAVKDTFRKAGESLSRPIVEAGEGLATWAGELSDQFSNAIHGRTTPIGRLGRDAFASRLSSVMSSSTTPEQLGITNLGQSLVDPGAMGNFNLFFQESQQGGASSANRGLTPRQDALRAAGVTAVAGGSISLGKGFQTSLENVRTAAMAEYQRGTNPNVEGFKKDSASRDAFSVVRQKIREMFTRNHKELKALRESSTESEYRTKIMTMLFKDPSTASALNRLIKMSGSRDSEQVVLNVIAAVQADLGATEGGVAIKFGRGTMDLLSVGVGSPGELNKKFSESIGELSGILGLSQGETRDVLSAEWAPSMLKWLQGDKEGGAAFESATMRDKRAEDLLNRFESGGGKGAAGPLASALAAQGLSMRGEVTERLKAVGGAYGRGVGGISEATRAAIGGVADLYKKGSWAGGSEAARNVHLQKGELSKLSRGSLLERQVATFSLVGGLGDMTTSQFEDFQRRQPRQSGIDVFSLLSDDERSRMMDMARSGGGIHGGEISSVRDMLRKATERAPAMLGSKKAPEGLDPMTSFADASTRFVAAATSAITLLQHGSDSNLEEIKSTMSEVGKQLKGQ